MTDLLRLALLLGLSVAASLLIARSARRARHAEPSDAPESAAASRPQTAR